MMPSARGGATITRTRVPRADGGVEPAGQIVQKIPFGLFVPVGLLHRAARMADRLERAAGRVGSLVVGRRVVLLENFPRL